MRGDVTLAADEAAEIGRVLREAHAVIHRNFDGTLAADQIDRALLWADKLDPPPFKPGEVLSSRNGFRCEVVAIDGDAVWLRYMAPDVGYWTGDVVDLRRGEW